MGHASVRAHGTEQSSAAVPCFLAIPLSGACIQTQACSCAGEGPWLRWGLEGTRRDSRIRDMPA